jgi:hypothetical protein
MNAKILILLFLVAVLVIPENNARGKWRVRRIRVRKVVRWVCRIYCQVKICKWVKINGHLSQQCSKACHRVCHKVFGKKRDALADEGMVNEFENDLCMARFKIYILTMKIKL